MDFKSLLSQLDQLNEATTKTKTGLKHTAEPGGYGRKDDEDEEGNKVKAPTEKRGKGRPKKATQSSGEDKKYDFSAFGVKHGKDVKLPKHDKKKTTKHSLKEYFDALDKEMMNEAEQIQIKPASQVPKLPGQPAIGAAAGKPATMGQATGQQKNTQVIQQGNKTLGTVDNPQLAQQIKQSIGKGEMTLMPESEEEMTEAGYSAKAARAGKDIGKPGKNFAKIAKSAAERYGSKERGEKVAGAVLAKLRGKTNEGDMPPNDSNLSPIGESAKPDFLDLDKDGNKKESMKKAANDKKKVKEGMEHKLKSARHTGKAHALARESYNCKYDDMEEARHYHEGYKEGLDECYGQMPIQGYVGEANKEVADMASYGAHTLDEDGGQVAKQKVSDWLRDPRLDAQVMKLQVPGLNITNPQKGISGHDMYGGGMSNPLKDLYTDAKNPMYFKEFLSHIMKKLGDVVVTGTLQAGPAPAMEGDMDEGNAFTKALATTPQGGKFSVGGNTFTDRSGYDAKIEESPFAFEAWDKELNAILESKEEVAEGMTVSISKGQQGQPDSVSVNAQDGEADQLLSIIKQAGLGLFGGDDQAGPATGSQPMSVAVDGEQAPAEIDVVDDHDDMLSLIRKMTGQGPATQAGDYEEEEGQAHAHDDEESTCETCGESACGCDSEEAIEEDETMYQREYEVAEDESGGDDSEESDEVNSDATRDAALAQAAGQNFADTDKNNLEEGGDGGEASEEDEEEQVEESYANGDDDTFESDIDFMTNVITGGLNGRKVQHKHGYQQGDNPLAMKESTDLLTDWRKLSGIK